MGETANNATDHAVAGSVVEPGGAQSTGRKNRRDEVVRGYSRLVSGGAQFATGARPLGVVDEQVLIRGLAALPVNDIRGIPVLWHFLFVGARGGGGEGGGPQPEQHVHLSENTLARLWVALVEGAHTNCRAAATSAIIQIHVHVVRDDGPARPKRSINANWVVLTRVSRPGRRRW